MAAEIEFPAGAAAAPLLASMRPRRMAAEIFDVLNSENRMPLRLQ